MTAADQLRKAEEALGTLLLALIRLQSALSFTNRATSEQSSVDVLWVPASSERFIHLSDVSLKLDNCWLP